VNIGLIDIYSRWCGREAGDALRTGML